MLNFSKKKKKKKKMLENIKFIDIPSFTTNDSTVYYTILVKTEVREWSVSHRYNHFLALNNAFSTKFPDNPTPVELPAKTFRILNALSNFGILKSSPDEESIEERKEGLKKYLLGILN